MLYLVEYNVHLAGIKLKKYWGCFLEGLFKGYLRYKTIFRNKVALDV